MRARITRRWNHESGGPELKIVEEPPASMPAAEYRRRQGLAPAGADRKPRNLKLRVESETALQIAVADWLRLLAWTGNPPVWTHPANERKSLLESVRCHRMGQRAGIPDLLFWLDGGRTLAIELKTPEGSVSKEQRQVHSELAALSHACRVCRSVDDVRATLLEAQLEFREPPLAVAMRRAASEGQK